MDVALLALAVVAVAVGALDDARRAAGLVAVAVAAGRGGLVDEVHGHEGRHHQEHVHGAHLACLVDARETLDRLHLFPRTRRLVAAAAGFGFGFGWLVVLSRTADASVLAKIASKRLFIERGADFVRVPRRQQPARAGRRAGASTVALVAAAADAMSPRPR